MTKGYGRSVVAQAHLEEVRRQLGARSQGSGLMCPKCQGGQTRERSLSAWNQGARITAKCWRNACAFLGAWDATTGMGLGYTPPDGREKPRGFELDTLPLDQGMVAYVEARYRIPEATLRHFGARQYPSSRGVYLPARDVSGAFRGWVLRWTDGTLPKVRSYPSPSYAGPWQAWYPATPGLVVLVEDVFSALRLWQAGVTAVAMLGTSVSILKAAELARNSTRVVVALDQDATARSIDAARLHNFAYRRLLDADIKDMTEEQLTQWITSLTSSLQVSTPGKPIAS